MSDINLIIQRIIEARKKAGLSQRELAEKAGVSNSLIAKYELGKIQDIPVNKLQDIAKALNVTPEWLIGIDEGSELKREIFRIVDSLTDEQLQNVSVFLNYLKNKDK